MDRGPFSPSNANIHFTRAGKSFPTSWGRDSLSYRSRLASRCQGLAAFYIIILGLRPRRGEQSASEYVQGPGLGPHEHQKSQNTKTSQSYPCLLDGPSPVNLHHTHLGKEEGPVPLYRWGTKSTVGPLQTFSANWARALHPKHPAEGVHGKAMAAVRLLLSCAL